jgi:hypothetical protein
MAHFPKTILHLRNTSQQMGDRRRPILHQG